ncbi:hypothetical protein [Lignipirellula cremea]|uniref:Uncharacterized protein n=1 Tax=Lignipirellula cremea TaxID=2528010 RepID=A0A518E0D1_9BACT|nr:hypothetical protein [Lignipirellula cremea]QDU97542.1 hypothetical protein Pla8534_53900 [Lignipirellula cremea]
MQELSIGAGIALAGGVVGVALALSKAATDIWGQQRHPDIESLWAAVRETNHNVARLTTDLAVMVEKVQTLVETVKDLAQTLRDR